MTLLDDRVGLCAPPTVHEVLVAIRAEAFRLPLTDRIGEGRERTAGRKMERAAFDAILLRNINAAAQGLSLPSVEERMRELGDAWREAWTRGYQTARARYQGPSAVRLAEERRVGIRLAARTAQQAGFVDAAWAIRDKLLPTVERRETKPGMDGEGI